MAMMGGGGGDIDLATAELCCDSVFKAIQDGAMEVKVSYAVLLDACQAVLAAKSTPKSTDTTRYNLAQFAVFINSGMADFSKFPAMRILLTNSLPEGYATQYAAQCQDFLLQFDLQAYFKALKLENGAAVAADIYKNLLALTDTTTKISKLEVQALTTLKGAKLEEFIARYPYDRFITEETMVFLTPIVRKLPVSALVKEKTEKHPLPGDEESESLEDSRPSQTQTQPSQSIVVDTGDAVDSAILLVADLAALKEAAMASVGSDDLCSFAPGKPEVSKKKGKARATTPPPLDSSLPDPTPSPHFRPTQRRNRKAQSARNTNPSEKPSEDEAGPAYNIDDDDDETEFPVTPRTKTPVRSLAATKGAQDVIRKLAKTTKQLANVDDPLADSLATASAIAKRGTGAGKRKRTTGKGFLEASETDQKARWDSEDEDMQRPAPALPDVTDQDSPKALKGTRTVRGGKMRRLVGNFPPSPKGGRWSLDEIERLKKGVERFGKGEWRKIQSVYFMEDGRPTRSNVNIKDKWRNLERADEV